MSSQRPQVRLSRPLFTVLTMAALVSIVAAGCRRAATDGAKSTGQAARKVAVTRPAAKTIYRDVGQPGLIQAYERTPIVSKIPGYVLEWNYDLDIGAPIHKGDTLARLWVPEMLSELKLKEEMVAQSKKALAVSKAQIATAQAQVQVAQAAVTRAEANHNFWKSQSDRFTALVKSDVLDKQSQEETLNQYRSASAALTEAQARVQSARAVELEKESAREKAEADVRAADADRQRQADLVGYATLTAPYDGVVTQRNINTRQFVQPATGPRGDVLYVVERTDIVRIFVSVPETDADWVHVGTPATVRIQALQGQEFKGKVTRTAWSLNNVTRTLLTEIDLDNPELPKLGRRLRPGMYAYATVTAESRDVLTVPVSAVVTEGDVNIGYKNYCYVVEDGRVKQTPIEIGARNDQLVELRKKQVAPARNGEESRWEAFTGNEAIVRGDLSGLKDGQEVEAEK